jgi:hypothetical protein
VTSADLFRQIIVALDQAGIPHMLTGSFASAYHGSPRATQDINLVIEADAGRLRALIDLLSADSYYVDLDAAIETLGSEGQFNIIELQSGWKIDLMIRKQRQFSREEFARRRPAQLQGTAIDVVTAEDLIIAKLEWAKNGGSRRQLEDVASILRIRGTALDFAHVERWVEALGLGDQWHEARGMVERQA